MAQITDYTKAGVDAAIGAAVNAAPTKAHKASHATGGTDALTPADIGAQPAGSYVPTTRTVAGKALSSNITLTAADVGASTFSGAYADLSGKPTLGTAADNAETDFATAAQGSKADETYAGTQPVNAQTGTTYTLQASDAGKLVTLTNAAAITLTIPGNVFTVPAGKVVRVDCLVAGAGMVTAVGSSCTVNGTPSLVSRAQWSAFTVLFTSATTAVLIGDLA